MKMFLNGTAMSGQADHRFLLGSSFLRAAHTAPRYRFYAVRDEFPGLVPVDAEGGSIEGEVYEIDDEVWQGSLGPAEPEELALGEIELDDESVVNAMILNIASVKQSEITDITEHGGWRAYLRFLGVSSPRERSS